MSSAGCCPHPAVGQRYGRDKPCCRRQPHRARGAAGRHRRRSVGQTGCGGTNQHLPLLQSLSPASTGKPCGVPPPSREHAPSRSAQDPGKCLSRTRSDMSLEEGCEGSRAAAWGLHPYCPPPGGRRAPGHRALSAQMCGSEAPPRHGAALPVGTHALHLGCPGSAAPSLCEGIWGQGTCWWAPVQPLLG